MKFIYVLVDPRDQTKRYVGQTVNPHGRKIAWNFERPGLVGLWLQQLDEESLRPEMVVIDEADDVDVYRVERHWIEKLWSDGEPLLNLVGIPGRIAEYRESRLRLDLRNLGYEEWKTQLTQEWV